MRLRIFFMVLGNFLFICGVSLIIFTYAPILFSELKYKYFPKPNPPVTSSTESSEDESSVEESTIVQYTPIDNKFSIIIPKIDVNAPVVQNVTMVNEKAYMDALRFGVAHAVGTPLPGEPGNIFLFAHSSLNFWQLGPYATVFNLLNKLEKNDIVLVFYDGKYYEYLVQENYTVPGWDTSPFDEDYSESIITLVTCDPPGTTINRRIVKAKLLTII